MASLAVQAGMHWTSGAVRDIQDWGLILGSSLAVVMIIVRQIVTIGENNRLNEKLWAFSKELEQRVVERTVELAQRVEQVTALNQQVQQANDELRQLDRLRSEFVSNVTHELRTPLTGIVGFTEFLLSPSSDPLTPLQVDSLEMTYSSAQRLLRLVNDLLDVSRMEAGRFTINATPLSPVPLLQQVVKEAQLRAENKGIKLETDLPDELPSVCADGSRVAQVLNNLLSNAIKFTPPAGRVTVKSYILEVRSPSTTLLTAVSSPLMPRLPDGHWLMVCVEDTGAGIAAGDLPRLFSRFYRTSDAQRKAVNGTGLGLYVAKSIVEAHGGQIGVESQVGQGSRFWFALLIHDTTPGPGPNPSKSDSSALGRAEARPAGEPQVGRPVRLPG
jgi:signal transduction histidine kinase